MNILCIDDAVVIRQSLEHILVKAGYEVDLASDAAEGLDFLEKKSYDFVISDINMPGQSGIEMLEIAKSRGKIPAKTILLMLTTETNKELMDKGKALGVKCWIVKPYNKDSLLQSLKTLKDLRDKASA